MTNKNTNENKLTIDLSELTYMELRELREIVIKHMHIEQITVVQKEMAKR